MTIIMTIIMIIVVIIINIIENITIIIVIIINIKIIRSETGAWLHTGVGREINVDLGSVVIWCGIVWCGSVGKTRPALLAIIAASSIDHHLYANHIDHNEDHHHTGKCKMYDGSHENPIAIRNPATIGMDCKK